MCSRGRQPFPFNDVSLVQHHCRVKMTVPCSSECDSLSVQISGTPSATAHLHTGGHVGCYLLV